MLGRQGAALRSGRRGFGGVLAGQRAFAEEAEGNHGLSQGQVSALLRAAEGSLSLAEGAISHVDYNRLGANDPVEDNLAAVRSLPSASLFFGVFDGHGGRFCSEAVARRLFDYATAAVSHRHVRGYDRWSREQSLHLLNSAPPLDEPDHHGEHLRRFVAERMRHEGSARSTVRRALQAAFQALDEDLSSDALAEEEGSEEAANRRLRAVLSGSCACVAHIRGPHLHIANVGDSSAVLAVRQELPGGGVSWTARQLTQEHTVENSLEVRRIRSEHPKSEEASVLRGGRLLAELMPLRAFGDVRYKWSRQTQESKLGPGIAPPSLLTPPYLNALPEVYYHRLSPNDRFLVIASDGLWECLSPDRVVRLLADHTVGKDAAAPFEPLAGSSLDDALAALRRRKAGEGKQPLDINSATHLLRVALGGSRREEQLEALSASLSIPPGPARNTRDDITLQVIYFDEDFLRSRAPDPPA